MGEPKRCPHAGNCALFPLFKYQSLLNIWKLEYCERDYERCTRYQKSLRGEAAPDDMLPNGETISLIRKGNKL